jgi:hypothetical protein
VTRAAWVALVLVGCAAREPVAAPLPRTATEPPCPAVPTNLPAPPTPALQALAARKRTVWERPYTVTVPSSYDGVAPAPVIVEIHGFEDEPNDVEQVLGLSPVAAAHGVLLVLVSGDEIVHAGGGNFGEPKVLKILRDTGLPLPSDVHLANYPDLQITMAPWIAGNGCQPDAEPGPAQDLDYNIPGNETTVERWRGCRAPTERWTIHKAGHVPTFRSSWAQQVYDFLQLHPKG